MPMHVPGGRDVRQVPAIGSFRAGTWSSVCKHRAPRPVRERRLMLCPFYIGTQHQSPQSVPSPHSKNHSQDSHLTPSSPPSVNPFPASHIYTVISAYLYHCSLYKCEWSQNSVKGVRYVRRNIAVPIKSQIVAITSKRKIIKKS